MSMTSVIVVSRCLLSSGPEDGKSRGPLLSVRGSRDAPWGNKKPWTRSGPRLVVSARAVLPPLHHLEGGHRSPVDVAARRRESRRVDGVNAEVHCRQIAPLCWWLMVAGRHGAASAAVGGAGGVYDRLVADVK
jgi:hypothetical protein